MAMDTLALCLAKACRQFLDGQQLFPWKPELIVESDAIR